MGKDDYLNSESRELSACLSVLFQKNIKKDEYDHLRFKPYVLFNELCRAGAFLRYSSVTWLDEDGIFDRIALSDDDVTVLTDYNGNIAMHDLFNVRGFLRPFRAY